MSKKILLALTVYSMISKAHFMSAEAMNPSVSHAYMPDMSKTDLTRDQGLEAILAKADVVTDDMISTKKNVNVMDQDDFWLGETLGMFETEAKAAKAENHVSEPLQLDTVLNAIAEKVSSKTTAYELTETDLQKRAIRAEKREALKDQDVLMDQDLSLEQMFYPALSNQTESIQDTDLAKTLSAQVKEFYESLPQTEQDDYLKRISDILPLDLYTFVAILCGIMRDLKKLMNACWNWMIDLNSMFPAATQYQTPHQYTCGYAVDAYDVYDLMPYGFVTTEVVSIYDVAPANNAQLMPYFMF